MATYLSLVNDVLTRLREPTCTSVTDTSYSQLIGLFVNEAKREVEDAFQWDALSTSVDITCVPAQRNYNLTGSTTRTRILDVYNTSKRWRMQQAPSNDYMNRLLALTATQSSAAYVFDIFNVDTTTGELVLRFNPVPTEADVIKFYLINPQPDFTSNSTVLSIPKDPVIQLAYLKAINERGEDSGRASEIQERLYLRTLGDAIAQDDARSSDGTLWQPV